MTFDWSDFVAPLTGPTLAMALMLGLSTGWLSEHVLHQHLGNDHLFWAAGTGFVFFIPLSLLRGWEGSDQWERFLATLVLWVVFCVGKWLGSARP